MILGTEARPTRSPEGRGRGHLLGQRLYPTAPFEPWQSVLTYVTPPVDSDADGAVDSDLGGDLGSDGETYEAASESM